MNKGSELAKAGGAGTESRKGNLPSPAFLLFNFGWSLKRKQQFEDILVLSPKRQHVDSSSQTKSGFVYSIDPLKVFPTSVWI